MHHHVHEFAGRSLAELTGGYGYFAQAQFIKEFKELSVMTPSQFFDDNNDGFADV